ncbi:acyltransferase family protein [Escherichia coli]|nr:acyltransferase family protein [Escherichia coli]
MPNKNENLEVMRIISILGVILIHMSMGYYSNFNIINSSDWIIAGFVTSISKFSVPLFFIISSYLFFSKDGNEFGRSVKSIKRVTIALVAWSFIHWFIPFTDASNLSFKKLIFTIFVGQPSFHLWFLYSYILLCLSLPILKAAFNSMELKHYSAIVVTGVFILFFTPSLVSILTIKDTSYINNSQTAFRADVLIYAAVTPILIKAPKLNKSILVITFLALSVISTALTYWLSEQIGKISDSFNNLTSIFIIIESICLFLVFINVSYNLTTRLKKTILTIGECCFGAYLCHWIIYLTLDRLGLMMHSSALTSIPYDTLLIAIFSFAAAYLMRMNPVLRKIC